MSGTSLKEKPVISVITVCKDSWDLLCRTVESVLQQDSELFEYIVVDGASSDGTADFLCQYSNSIRWISEPDKGISNAFNKGIKMAKGDYLFFLNSGDTFVSKNSISMVSAVIADSEAPIITFNVDVSGEGIWFKDERGFVEAWDDSMIPHQGTFVRRDVFDVVGDFNENLKLRMDYDFFKRCYKNGYPFKYDTRVIAALSPWGVSSSNEYIFRKEGLAIRVLHDNHIEYNDISELAVFMPQIKTDIKAPKTVLAELRVIDLNQRIDDRFRSCAIYGAGNGGKKLYSLLKSLDNIDELYVCDSYNYGRLLENGKVVRKPEEVLSECSFVSFIISVQEKRIADEIKNSLLDKGIKHEKIYFYNMNSNVIYNEMLD